MDYVIEMIVETQKIINMGKVIFGNNQFLAFSFLTDEKSRNQSIQFKDN